MDRCDAADIGCVGICSGSNQTVDHSNLSDRIPRVAVRCVMKWLGSTPIPCSTACSVIDQDLADFESESRCCHMKSCVSGIHVVFDLREKTLRCFLSRCANLRGLLR